MTQAELDRTVRKAVRAVERAGKAAHAVEVDRSGTVRIVLRSDDTEGEHKIWKLE